MVQIEGKADLKNLIWFIIVAGSNQSLSVLSNENRGGSILVSTIQFDKLSCRQVSFSDPKWTPSRMENIRIKHPQHILTPSLPVRLEKFLFLAFFGGFSYYTLERHQNITKVCADILGVKQ